MKYFFGTHMIENSQLTTAQVKEAWSQQFPEIANAVVEEHEDGIHFVKRSGTKG